MGFWNREEIMPKVVDVYGPYQDVRGQLDQTYDQAQNRSSQKINQLYANVGMNPRGAPATSAKARATTDIENQRAQTGYDSYYQWLRGKQLATPQIQPSGASTLAAPFISGIGQAMGPGIVAGAAKGIGQGIGQGWDWMTGGGPMSYVPNISSSGYTSGAPSYGEGGYGEYSPSSAFQDVPAYDFSSDVGGAYDWMNGGSNLDYADAFNWF